MHRSEAVRLYRCAACGAETSIQDRAFPFGEDEVLCFACAVDRGGSYIEGYDKWKAAPGVQDLFPPPRDERSG